MKFFSFLSKRILIVSISLIPSFLLSGCGSGEQIISAWPNKPIQIDGDSRDWEGSLQSFTKDKYSVGFKNDDKYLYLCFITTDREKITKIMISGLNVTFNSPSDKRRDYTIAFPVVSPEMMKGTMGPDNGDAMPGEEGPMPKQGDMPPKGKGPSPFQQILERQLNFNLIEKDYTNSISLKNNEGIELKMGASNDFLTYEMKIPLASAKSSFPVGAMPGEKINVTIETVQMKMPSKDGAKPGGGPDGQVGGMQGGIDMTGGGDMQGAGPGGMQEGGPGGMQGRGGRGGGRGGRPGASKANDKFSAEFSVQLGKSNEELKIKN